MAIATINPATGERIREFAALRPDELEERLRLAREAFSSWSHTPLTHRIAVIRRVGELLDERRNDYAKLMTLEMGKLIAAAREEAAKCTTGCRYYVEQAPRALADEDVVTGEERGYVAF